MERSKVLGTHEVLAATTSNSPNNNFGNILAIATGNTMPVGALECVIVVAKMSLSFGIHIG